MYGAALQRILWLPHVQPCVHPSAALAPRKSAGMIEMFMRIQKIADIFRVEAKIADILCDFRGGLQGLRHRSGNGPLGW